MKYVITGGAGFIGSAMVRFLLKKTNNIVLNVDSLTYAGHQESLLEVSGSKRYLFRQLDLRDNKIGDDGLHHLSNALPAMKALETLVLSGNEITDVGLKHLAIPLEKNTSLKTLWLNGNKITDDNLKMKIKDIWNKTKYRERGLLL